MKNWTPEAALGLIAEKPHLVLRETVGGDMLDPILMGAIFSPEKVALYRYMLWRIWNIAFPVLIVIMLNPSTADHEKNDRTIKGLVARAIILGCGGLLVVNCFALCASDPDEMKNHPAPIGPENDAAIKHALSQKHEMVLCAWGIDGVHLGREVEIKCQILQHNAKPCALKLCANGAPGHPLYIRQDTKPFALSITIPHKNEGMTRNLPR